MRKKLFILLTFVMIFLLFFSCGDKTATTSTTAASSTSTSGTETKLQTVESAMVPASMAYSSSRRRNTYTREGDNPCEGVSFMGCQTILVRMYLAMSKTFVTVLRQMVSEIGSNLGDVADGATGTHTAADHTAQYAKTDANNFKILVKDSSDNPALHLTVADSTITLISDLQFLPASIRTALGDSAPETNEKVQLTLTYTDENTWDLDARLTGIACSSNDVAAPGLIVQKVSKANGLVKGKSMMHSPRWVSTGTALTCDDTATDYTGTNIYADFVANDTAAKAMPYMLARNETSVSTTHNLDKYCENYVSADDTLGPGELYTNSNSNRCTGLYQNDSFVGSASDYPSPFAFQISGGVPVPAWGNDGSTYDSAVGAADYGAATDWIAPSDLLNVTVTVPSTL